MDQMTTLDVLIRFAPLFLLATDPPYSMGIFETIVAVHFGCPLAVKFYDGSA